MKNYIYLNDKGELVADNTPNATCYISLEYAKVLRNAEDKAESFRKLNDQLSKENDTLKEQVKVQKLIISRLELGEPVGHIDHDNQSVWEGGKK